MGFLQKLISGDCNEEVRYNVSRKGIKLWDAELELTVAVEDMVVFKDIISPIRAGIKDDYFRLNKKVPNFLKDQVFTIKGEILCYDSNSMLVIEKAKIKYNGKLEEVSGQFVFLREDCKKYMGELEIENSEEFMKAIG